MDKRMTFRTSFSGPTIAIRGWRIAGSKYFAFWLLMCSGSESLDGVIAAIIDAGGGSPLRLASFATSPAARRRIGF